MPFFVPGVNTSLESLRSLSENVRMTARLVFTPKKGIGSFSGKGHKVGRSKPFLVLTGGFKRLKPPRSICKKVVNMNLSGRLKILRGVLEVD